MLGTLPPPIAPKKHPFYTTATVYGAFRPTARAFGNSCLGRRWNTTLILYCIVQRRTVSDSWWVKRFYHYDKYIFLFSFSGTPRHAYCFWPEDDGSRRAGNAPFDPLKEPVGKSLAYIKINHSIFPSDDYKRKRSDALSHPSDILIAGRDGEKR